VCSSPGCDLCDAVAQSVSVHSRGQATTMKARIAQREGMTGRNRVVERTIMRDCSIRSKAATLPLLLLAVCQRRSIPLKALLLPAVCQRRSIRSRSPLNHHQILVGQQQNCLPSP
jgi:hypothetical protein